MTIFKQIATSREWWKMSPDQSLFGFGVSSEKTLNTAMRTKDRRCAILYFASQTQAFVHLDRIDARNVKCTGSILPAVNGAMPAPTKPATTTRPPLGRVG